MLPYLGKLRQIQGQSQVQSIKSTGISTETYLMLNKTSNSKVPLAIFVLRFEEKNKQNLQAYM